MILRKLEVDDLTFLLEIRNHESTRKFLENNSVFTYDECLNWFNTTKPNWFIIEVNNERVGYIRTNGNEVGCDIHPNFRRKGFARAAYKEYLKDKDFASLWVFSDNFAKNLYLELGFNETGNKIKIRNREYIEMEYKVIQ